MSIADKLTTIATNAQKVNESNEQLEYLLEAQIVGRTLQENVNMLDKDMSSIETTFANYGVGGFNGAPLGAFTDGIDEVYNKGAKSEYDKFWDAFQNKGGNSMPYGSYAFAYGFWTDKTFFPKHDIIPYQSSSDYFYDCRVTNLRERIDGRGLKLDLSRTNTIQQYFRESKTCEVPDMDTSHIKNFTRPFYNASKLHTIPRLNMTSATSVLDAFYQCINLQNITFEGTIPISISFKDCSLLTHESLISIIEHLRDYVAEGSTATHTLTLGPSNLVKLTEAEQQIAIDKGWELK